MATSETEPERSVFSVYKGIGGEFWPLRKQSPNALFSLYTRESGENFGHFGNRARTLCFLCIQGNRGRILATSETEPERSVFSVYKGIGGAFWCILVHFGAFLVHFGAFWCIFGVFWCILVHFWCILVYFGVFWCILVHFGAFWCIFGAFWCILVHFWCILVYFGAFWCILVHFWCILVHFGAFLVYFGVFWCILVHFWCILVYFGAFWCIFGVFWCILVYFGAFWCILVHFWCIFGAFWCILVYFGVFWCILVHFGAFWCIFGVFWCILVHFGAFWCILVHFWCILVHFWCILVHFWCIFGAFWCILVHFWCILVHFWCILVHFWCIFGAFWCIFWSLRKQSPSALFFLYTEKSGRDFGLFGNRARALCFSCIQRNRGEILVSSETEPERFVFPVYREIGARFWSLRKQSPSALFFLYTEKSGRDFGLFGNRARALCFSCIQRNRGEILVSSETEPERFVFPVYREIGARFWSLRKQSPSALFFLYTEKSGRDFGLFGNRARALCFSCIQRNRGEILVSSETEPERFVFPVYREIGARFWSLRKQSPSALFFLYTEKSGRDFGLFGNRARTLCFLCIQWNRGRILATSETEPERSVFSVYNGIGGEFWPLRKQSPNALFSLYTRESGENFGHFGNRARTLCFLCIQWNRGVAEPPSNYS